MISTRRLAYLGVFVSHGLTLMRRPLGRSPCFSTISHLRRTITDRSEVQFKFDPTDENAYFTDIGVLPFFQERLDKHHRSTRNSELDSSDSLHPTRDQRTLLASLNSQYSLVLKGGPRTGKSLSLLLYALQLSLVKVPRFGMFEEDVSSVDSVILAPTDELLQKYQSDIKKLIEGIPAKCCPHKLIPDDTATGEFKLIRRELVIDIVDSNSKVQRIKTGISRSENLPQILITTPSKLEELLFNADKPDVYNFKGCRFIAVDDFDMMMSTSQIGSQATISRVGRKGKYVPKLERCIRELQKIHIEHYSETLLVALKATETSFKESEAAGNKFKHTEFVLEDHSLTSREVDSRIMPVFKGSPKLESPHPSLLKKLIKQKRKFLYKQIQLCFISQPTPPYYDLLYQLSAQKRNFENKELTRLQSERINSKAEAALRDKLTKYLVEKMNRETDVDYQTRIIKKMIRLDDDMSSIGKSERNLLTAGAYNLEDWGVDKASNELAEGPKKVSIYFLEASSGRKRNKVEIKNVDVVEKMPEKIDWVRIIEDNIRKNGTNLENEEKTYLKDKLASLSSTSGRSNNDNTVKIVSKTIKSFRSTGNSAPFLVVVPHGVELNAIKKALSEKVHESFDEFSDVSDEHSAYSSSQHLPSDATTEPTPVPRNIIVHPHQLIGQSLDKIHNILACGIETLIPQLAFTPIQHDLTEKAIKAVAGIEYPYIDLFHLYIGRLLNSSVSEKKNLVITLNHCTEKSKPGKRMTDKDFEKLASVILYNDLTGVSDIKTLPNIETQTLEYPRISKLL